MTEYIKELMETWTSQGEQAAYAAAERLLQEIRDDVVRLQKEEEAIKAVGAVLRAHPDVDTSADPKEPEPNLDILVASERSKKIIEAANEAYWDRENNNWTHTGTSLLKTQEVLDHLRSQGLDLGVQQPLAVVGTVLSSANGFHRIARNTFEVLRNTDESEYESSGQSGYGDPPQSEYGVGYQSKYGRGPVDVVDDLPF